MRFALYTCDITGHYSKQLCTAPGTVLDFESVALPKQGSVFATILAGYQLALSFCRDAIYRVRDG